MTDNEIVKALECCTTNVASCKDCPAFVKVDRSNCKKYFRGAIDLINRLQAENDTLKNVIKNSFLEKAGCNIDPLAEIKTEAYKEFAERLLLCYEDFDEINEVILLENLVKAIDDLLKEMEGEK